jgi:hypothetical protein
MRSFYLCLPRSLATRPFRRSLHAVPIRLADNTKPGVGEHSRTRPEVRTERPPETDLGRGHPVRGIGKDQHTVPTLPTFSLAGRVGIVTGGARGLGLVMGQAMVYSGADLAIVDING